MCRFKKGKLEAESELKHKGIDNTGVTVYYDTKQLDGEPNLSPPLFTHMKDSSPGGLWDEHTDL